MSRTALEFRRLAAWCDWQFEETLSPWQEARLQEAWAKVRRDAAYLIGYMA